MRFADPDSMIHLDNHEEDAVRFGDSFDFLNRLSHIIYVIKGINGRDHIEAGVGERDVLGVCLAVAHFVVINSQLSVGRDKWIKADSFSSHVCPFQASARTATDVHHTLAAVELAINSEMCGVVVFVVRVAELTFDLLSGFPELQFA